MSLMPTTQRYHISSAYNLEIQIWRARFIDNKIGKTQEKFLTFIFLIPGATNFTTFIQVSQSMYVSLFGINQESYINMYHVTKLVPLRLGCTKFPFDRNITGPFTHATLPTGRISIKILSCCNFSWWGFYLHPIIFISSSLQRGRFHPNSTEINEQNE